MDILAHILFVDILADTATAAATAHAATAAFLTAAAAATAAATAHGAGEGRARTRPFLEGGAPHSVRGGANSFGYRYVSAQSAVQKRALTSIDS